MTTAVGKWPACARLWTVAPAGYLPTALTSLGGTQPNSSRLHRCSIAPPFGRMSLPQAQNGARKSGPWTLTGERHEASRSATRDRCVPRDRRQRLWRPIQPRGGR